MKIKTKIDLMDLPVSRPILQFLVRFLKWMIGIPSEKKQSTPGRECSVRGRTALRFVIGFATEFLFGCYESAMRWKNSRSALSMCEATMSWARN